MRFRTPTSNKMISFEPGATRADVVRALLDEAGLRLGAPISESFLQVHKGGAVGADRDDFDLYVVQVRGAKIGFLDGPLPS